MNHHNVNHVSKIYIVRRFLNFTKKFSKYSLTPDRIVKQNKKRSKINLTILFRGGSPFCSCFVFNNYIHTVIW